MIAAEEQTSLAEPVLEGADTWIPAIDRARGQALVKRAIDVGASLLLLVLLVPIYLLVALAIKLDSPGPVFFNRHRVAKGGRPFLMYKFRTMVQDAETRLQMLQHLNEGGVYMIKIHNDPRVTRVGRFLRSTSLDELPQLLNVLKGEMSLVGPRPQAPNEVALYTPRQRRRLTMRPGITGWWQVRSRHEPSFDVMVARDIEYISRWSLWFDAEIALGTVAMLVTDTGKLFRAQTFGTAVKVALVHDYLFEQGGAENVFEVLAAMFPEAPIYTSIYAPDTMSDSFRKRTIHTSFLQRITTDKTRAKALLPLYPLAFRSLKIRGYDVVLSSSSSFAKGIDVGDARHICYCHTPPRFLWQPDRYIERQAPRWKRAAAGLVVGPLRRIDRRAAGNVDMFIANSRLTQARIKRLYGREASVIYPPIRLNEFAIAEQVGDHYLIVSRMLPYKRIDLAIEACNRLRLRLVVIGDGPERARLEALAGPTVTFRGRLPRSAVCWELARCKALITAGEEDFGLTPLEANASGRPVIAYRAGGALETVVAGKTGWFFDEQCVDSLQAVLCQTERDGPDRLGPTALRCYAERFDLGRFRDGIRGLLEDGPSAANESRGRSCVAASHEM